MTEYLRWHRERTVISCYTVSQAEYGRLIWKADAQKNGLTGRKVTFLIMNTL